MLFKFMHCKPFDQDSTWYRNIVQPVHRGDLGGLSKLLRYFMLRRTKESHLPDLPPIHHKTIVLPMAPAAHEIYQQYYQRFLHQFGVESDVPFDSGEYFRQLSNLRISCVHPLEFKVHDESSINDMEENLGIMMPDNRNLQANARLAYKEDWIWSTKIQFLVTKLLARRGDEKKCKKSVIYTQWRCIIKWQVHLYATYSHHTELTASLCRITIAFEEQGIKYCSLHGGMTNEERTSELKFFSDSDDIEAFVVSIEAGGVGLNMTCADEVYLMVRNLNV